MIFRLHGWAATRWWWWAALLEIGAVVSIAYPEWAIAIAATAAGLVAKWKTTIRYGWVVSAPVSFGLIWIGWNLVGRLIVVGAFVWALIQTYEWAATTITVKTGSMEIAYGLFWPRTVRVSSRQIAAMQTDRGPGNLYALLGFERLLWDTSGQVEFRDRVNYATPALVAAIKGE